MADNLWALREQKRLSVATLASRAGLPIGLIMEYESGHRSIDPRHLTRLARALYVEESEIRLQSAPRPGSPPLERQPRREEMRPAASPNGTPPGALAGAPASSPLPAIDPAAGAGARLRERPNRGPRIALEPRPPAPPRPSQLAHLEGLLTRLGRTREALETELGKPFADLNRVEASKLLKELQIEVRTNAAERHRPYLPEAIDEYELRYLAAARDAGATLHFKLFDNSTLSGQVTGFSPYTITVHEANGNDTTVSKLAIVSYTRTDANGRETQQ